MNEIDQLIWRHDYDAAERQARRAVEEDPTNAAATSLLSRALKAQGRYDEALKCLQLTMDGSVRASGPGLDAASLCWMLERRHEAIQRTRRLVLGVQDGSVLYADRAGGVLQGVLMYYMATSLQDESAIQFALGYLGDRSSKPEIENWPGMLALLCLGQIDLSEAVRGATGETTVLRGTQVAATDLLKRRRLVAVLFYEGAKHAARRALDVATDYYRACAELENPIIENEWYLARHELKSA